VLERQPANPWNIRSQATVRSSYSPVMKRCNRALT
jgi:hypothetical protein